MADKAGISVIICTYNGTSQLPQTLRHLALQQVPVEIDWEIIVVDNASTEDTAEVARTEWQQYHLPGVDFTVLNEPRPRKYYALEKGVNNAKYEYIIICDDDNRLNDNYVARAYQTINSNTQFAAVGGQGIAVADQDIPAWFEQYQHIYAVGKPAVTSGDLSAKGYLWGAGMVFRKSLYQKANHQVPSLLLGPNQNESARAEDVELCMRFLLVGYLLYYDEGLVFSHHISSDRLTETYRDKLLDVKPHENRVLNLYRKQIGFNNLSTLKKSTLLIASWFRYLICKRFPGIKKWHYAYEAEIIYLLNGFKAETISDEAIQIRQLNLSLSNNSIA